MKASPPESPIEDGAIMIIIRCPYCQEQRTEEELIYGGKRDISRAPEPAGISDVQWTDELFMRASPKGPLKDQGCCAEAFGQWFLPQRDSATDKIREVI